ncbi:hypothetical protein [Bacillus mycoides]|uniref:hypothetical protein n=1 Tax=Bacillus mycoides TaxID=1405 RepID=UPI002E1EDA10|nr:hypothetical protein [Bacillus mycoides]
MSDIMKFITVLVPLLTLILMAFFKFIHRTEVEHLFETKIDQLKLNFSNNVIQFTILVTVFFLAPTIAFYLTGGLDIIKIDGNKEEVHNLIANIIDLDILLFYLFLITTLIFLMKWSHKTTILKSLTILTLLSSSIFYGLGTSMIIQNKAWSFLPVIIIFPLLVTFLATHVFYKTTPKKTNQVLCRIVTEEYIKELDLIHSYMLNDGRALLYDKYRSKDKVFYVCDYSSKVYLEFIKEQPDEDDI